MLVSNKILNSYFYLFGKPEGLLEIAAILIFIFAPHNTLNYGCHNDFFVLISLFV